MKKVTAKKINLIFWLVLAIVIMIYAYFAWSRYGEYTSASFMSSLIIHGGVCAFFCAVVDDAIERHYNKDQNNG